MANTISIRRAHFLTGTSPSFNAVSIFLTGDSPSLEPLERTFFFFFFFFFFFLGVSRESSSDRIFFFFFFLGVSRESSSDRIFFFFFFFLGYPESRLLIESFLLVFPLPPVIPLLQLNFKTYLNFISKLFQLFHHK